MTILGHRAFRKYPLRASNLIRSLLLAALLTVLWLAAQPAVGQLWGSMFTGGFRMMGLPATVSLVEVDGWLLTSVMPQINAPDILPDTFTIVVAGILTLAIFLITFRLPVSLTPLSYLLRAICFIQATAVIFFAVYPMYFPHSLGAYVTRMLEITIAYLSFIPALMGFTFFIFDFSLMRKALLTVLTITHLVILTPLQYLVHVYIIAKGSLLFMPVLYVMFGVLPQIAVFIAFYSWGMSWPDGRGERAW